MHENQTLSFFYFELSDIVNFLSNLGKPIPESKVVRKILRYLPERFRPSNYHKGDQRHRFHES